MTAKRPHRLHQSRPTRTYREGIHPDWLPKELSEFIEESAWFLGLGSFWEDEDGVFKERIEIRGDLKREVFATADAWVVIDDELVNDIVQLLIQGQINPSSEAFVALLTRNLCDYLLAFGGYGISSHLMSEAKKTPKAASNQSVDVELTSHYDVAIILEEADVAVKSILTLHEIGHLVGYCRRDEERDATLEAEWQDEFECDALATYYLLEFHRQYEKIWRHPSGSDIIVKSGFPNSLGHYEFILSAALLSREIADVAQRLLGGRYDASEAMRRVAFAKRRAIAASSLLSAQADRYYTPVSRDKAARAVQALHEAADALIVTLVEHESNFPEVWTDVNFEMTQSTVSGHRDILKQLFGTMCENLQLSQFGRMLLPIGLEPPEDPFDMSGIPEPRRDRGPDFPGASFRHRLFGNPVQDRGFGFVSKRNSRP